MSTETRTAPPQTGERRDEDPPRRGIRTVLGLVAAVLVAGAWLLPLWQATLHAPQYPGGLSMHAYGHQVTGDVAEIDSLNHYVGMRPFDPADVPEMRLWPVVVAVALAAVVVGLLRRTGFAGRLARLYLWLTPVGVLGMIQLRLYQYGHDLDPLAALRLDPFTPWVVGPTKVWNFTTWARPGLGLVAFVLAAAVVSFGPRIVSRFRGRGGRGAALAVLLVPALVAAAPAGGSSAPHEGHDPGSHDGPASAPATPAAVPEAGPAVVEHPPAGDLGDLLASVPEGGRLVLPPGTYQGPVVINRAIRLEGRDLPLILGGHTGSAITVRAPGTVLRGIAVRGSGSGPTGNPAGIRIEADDVRVEQVVVEQTYTGIAVAGAARVALVDNTIRGRAAADIGDDAHAVTHDGGASSTAVTSSPTGGGGHADAPGDPAPGLHAAQDPDAHHTPGSAAVPDGVAHAGAPGGDRGDGIWLHDTDGVLVQGNLVEDARDGIYLMFADRTLVDANHVRRSRYAVHSMWANDLALAENRLAGNLSGGVLMYGEGVLALKNTIVDNRSGSTGFGLLLKDVAGVQADRNVLADNRIGIHLDGPAGEDTQSVFAANTVARNQIGVAAYPSARAAFRANSFVDNLVQIMPQGGTLDGIAWIDQGAGNYWSSYRGYASAEPGRGAVAHLEGGAVDRLLLRSPELVALADTPAMRLLRSVEQRWGARTPVAVDHVPLTRPVSPPVPTDDAAPVGTPVGLALAALLLVPSILVLWRPRHRVRTPWRSPRAVTT